MDPLEQVDFGQVLDAVLVEQGLRELCPDLVFDRATKYSEAHPRQASVQGIFYLQRHICSMDRGTLPEVTVWANFKQIVEIPWYAADREDASIRYQEIMPFEEGYQDLYEDAQRGGDPSLMLNDKGKLLKLRAFGYESVGRRFLRVGWRHTFAKLLAAGLPGITHDALAGKFSIPPEKLCTLAHTSTPVEDEAALCQLL